MARAAFRVAHGAWRVARGRRRRYDRPVPRAIVLLPLAALLAALALAACGDAAPAAPPADATAAISGVTLAPGGTPSSEATPVLSAGEPAASTAGTARSRLSVIEFVRADGTVARLPVEVPPPTEYSIGLSGRRQLDERGMLFYYREVGRGSFWMKNTHINLAIAFVSASHRIVEVREMRAESTDLVTPSADYQYAVEAPAGWFRANGLAVGDEARFTFPLPRELTGG